MYKKLNVLSVDETIDLLLELHKIKEQIADDAGYK